MLNKDLQTKLGAISGLEIIEFLASKANGISLLFDITKIMDRATPLLKEIKNTFPEYTNHDIEHSKSVIKNIDEIVPNNLKSKLNSYEIYFLICSAILHDLGMIDFESDLDLDFNYSNKSINNEKYLNEIRERHHIRSEVFIIANYKDLNISDEYQARIIGRICRGHRKENINNISQFKNDYMYKDSAINIQLLASLLRIADELDLTFGKAPLIVYEHIRLKNPISVQHWKTHLSISGIGIDPNHKHIIKGTAICKDPIIHRNLKNLENKINYELNQLPLFLHQYYKFKNDFPSKFELNIETKDYDFIDLKFSLHDRKIIKILLGRRLYNREEEGIREILKNSIDAIRYRKEVLKINDLILKPKIIVKELEDSCGFTVSDNGIGMNKRIINNYFTRIGKSFYTSNEFFKRNIDFKPVGELGIGILSAFMISDEISFNTKMDNNDPIIVEIDDYTDYFIIRESYRTKVGTDIKLILKEDYKSKINLLREIKHYIRHLDFPIIYIDKDNMEHVITDDGFKPNHETFELWKKHNKTFEVLDIDYEALKGKIGFIITKKKNAYHSSTMRSWGFQKFLKENIDLEDNFNNRINFSYQGIFIGNLRNILPKYYEDHLIWMDIDFKNLIFDLNIARNDIVRNSKFEYIQELLEKSYLNCIVNFFGKFDNDDKSFQNSIIENLLDGSKISKYSKKKKLNPNILKFLYNFYFFKCLHNSKVLWLNANDMKSKKTTIYKLDIDTRWSSYPSENEVKELLLNSPNYKANCIYIIGNIFFSKFLDIELSINIAKFLSIIDIEKTIINLKFFPKAWKIYNFKGKKEAKFFEFTGYNKTLLNISHPFIDFLIKNKKIIEEYTEFTLTLKGFFKDLKRELKYNFEKVIENQKSILTTFIEKGLLDKKNLPNLLIKKEDLPDRFFNK